ncbi:dihydrodipicolinate reductase [Actinocorallia longicatena]|uniref:2,4-diaminopentanoate dehydrogenase C-terminal domain-containing protein n=1 Tax=Actinocorallia longicatena TaxID=111803 RepID=A0ABP6QFH4_9ACTN
MPIRVIQWATGGVGRAAVEGVLNHPDLELVGCRVYSPDKDGVDVGVLLGREPIGVPATSDPQRILDLDADCVVYAPLVPDESEVAALLRSGKDVVTPVGWVYPAEAGKLAEACAAGGSTLHGTGIHPGGITERFPLMASALSSAVTHVRAEEFSDIRTYNAPDVIRHIMGFGGTPEQALESPMLQLLTGGFEQSVRMVVDTLGFRIDPEIRTVQRVGLATAPVDSPIGAIEPGLVAARHFSWEANVDGVPVVTAAVNWLMGEEDLEEGWGFGPEGERFEVDVTGDPPVRLTFKGLHPESVAAGLARNPGIVATANHCVNAIPHVHRAGPGIKTYLDLPLIAGRAAPGLS